MADLDPIRQLQHLLDDPGKVLEKISTIQSALGAIKSPPDPAALAAAPLPASRASSHKTVSESADLPFDRLLQTVRDMQAQIEQRLRPLALQTVQAEVAYLREQAKRDQSALNACLAQIDRSIAACFVRIDELRQARFELSSIHKRLAELGAAAELLTENHDSVNPAAIIYSRLEILRRQGRI